MSTYARNMLYCATATPVARLLRVLVYVTQGGPSICFLATLGINKATQSFTIALAANSTDKATMLLQGNKPHFDIRKVH